MDAGTVEENHYLLVQKAQPYTKTGQEGQESVKPGVEGSLMAVGHLEKLPFPHGKACCPTSKPSTTDFLMVRRQPSRGLA